MSLSVRGIALQGFALTPIALAVQGLIAVLQEEEEKRQQVYGAGRRRRAPARRQESDDDIRLRVLDKWDAIEAAQAIDRVRTQAPIAKAGGVPASTHAAAASITPTATVLPIVAANAPQADPAAAAAAHTRIKRQIEDDLLALMLADVV